MKKWLVSGLIVIAAAATMPAVTLALSGGDRPQERPPLVDSDPEQPFDCDDVQTIWACGDQMAALAKLDLSNRRTLPLGAITIVSVEKVTWPDASLGVPDPLALYAQVLTPGYKVILAAEGRQYEYHTDSLNRVVPAQR
jgi:hypothetical protein